MQNEIIINAELGETRVALLEGGQFAELHIERERDRSVTGNVVKGVVSRVLPGMQAAFVDIGLEKAAFLYVGDYFESVLETGETDGEPGSGGRGKRNGRGGRSAPPRIDTVLHEGKEIVVQIAKEPIGTKGARITSSISIPGRHLVLTPWSRRVGVSRRIGSDKERRRLREIVERLRPQNLGFIIRTAGDGVREADLQADIRYLATVWAAIQQRHAEQSAPAILYSEHDLPLRIVRDLAGHDTKRIVADDKNVYESIQSFVDRFVADPKPRVEHYDEGQPVFERHDLERQIHANLERKVWLKSGGSLVIDKSEALTAIDVNTGRFVGKRDLEETVLKTNLEAVEEVVHQLRFRNLGGLIIIDLIDMESAGNREKVYRALQEALRADKARTNILKISELGLVEMTRKRTRENLVQTLCEPCGYCEGRSYILSRESVAFRVLREIKKHMPKLRGRPVAIAVNPHVAEELLTQSKAALAALNEEIGCDIEIRARPGIHQEQFELTVLEQGPPVEIELAWLQDRHPDAGGGNGGEDGAKRSSRRRGRGGRGRGASSEESIVAKGEIPAPEDSDSQDAEESPASPETATAPSERSDEKVRRGRANGPDEMAVDSDPGSEAVAESTPPTEPKRARAVRGKYETLDDPWDDDPVPPAGPASDLAGKREDTDTPEVNGTTDAAGTQEASPAEAKPTAVDSTAAGTARESVDASAAPDAPSTSRPDAESDETLQTVDAEAESRIIPRSE